MTFFLNFVLFSYHFIFKEILEILNSEQNIASTTLGSVISENTFI